MTQSPSFTTTTQDSALREFLAAQEEINSLSANAAPSRLERALERLEAAKSSMDLAA
ncbi:hypothetical protein [Actinomyces vulturis]|uniref:hypothetical protein n=1 Tax=Actinomyces vulturis TaxID=1857645 RepID=UPI00159EBA16|nr:hypothetical protein [Actinomyces vulturis]